MKSLYKLPFLSCLYVVFYSTYALGNLGSPVSHTGYNFKNGTNYTVHLSTTSCQQPRDTTKKCTSSLTLGPRQVSSTFVTPAEKAPPIIWKMQLTDTNNHTLCDDTILRVSFKKYHRPHGGYNYKPSIQYTTHCKGSQGFVTYTPSGYDKQHYNDYYVSTAHIIYTP